MRGLSYPKKWICGKSLLEIRFHTHEVKKVYLESHFKECQECYKLHIGETTLHTMYPDIIPPPWFRQRINANSKKYKSND